MIVFKAKSPARAFLLVSDWLIKNGNKTSGIIEILNGVIEFTDFVEGEFELGFDEDFREFLGDKRIDYASQVTFIEPTKSENNEYQYETVKKGWKNSYWGRMINYEGKYNQFENVIKILKKGKNTKRCNMQIWHPIYDANKMYDQPCLLSIDFKPRNKELYMTATFRSQRVSKSGYADYTALIEMGQFIAKECGLTLKKVTNIAHSMHLATGDELDFIEYMLESYSEQTEILGNIQ